MAVKEVHFSISSIIVAAVILLFVLQPVNAQDEKSSTAAYRVQPLRNMLAELTEGDILKSVEKFPDVPGHWARTSIGKLTSLGIISGMPDGTFQPEKATSADEYIAMVVRSLGYKLEQEGSYWAQVYIDKAIEDNIIDQDEIKDYKSPLVRELAAKIMVKAAMLFETAPNSNIYNYIRGQIKDYPNISNQRKQYVLQAYAMGLFGGDPQGNFNPGNNLTRGEASTIVIRLLDQEERKPMKPDDSEVLVLKDLQGTSYDVYSSSEQETFDTAVTLNNCIGRSKGYAFIVYNPFEQIINGGFYDSEDSYKQNFYSMDMSFIIYTLNDQTLNHPYEISVYNPLKVKNLHTEVIENLFTELFNDDGDKAMDAFNEYIQLSTNSTSAAEDNFVYNNRKVRLYKVENEHSFTVWIYDKDE
jgi:hypothetical protein